MRPGTRWTILVLLALLLVAAGYQISIALRGETVYPGPVPGTPLPTADATATPAG